MKRDERSSAVGFARRFGAVVVVLLAAGVWSPEVSAQQAVAGEFDRLIDIVEGDSSRVEALAAAHMTGELRRYMAPDDYASRLMTASEEVDDPLVDFVVRRRAVRSMLESSPVDEYDGDADFADDQACIVDWELVGPFANASMQGFEQRLEPERGEQGPYPGRLTDVDWRELSSGHHLCVYQLNSRVQPSTSAVAYLASTVTVDDDEPAKLLVGSRSNYRIWVNGEPVGQRDAEHGLGLDAEGWHVDLEAGDNEILVKLGSSGDGGLSWIARLVDRQGHPLDWSARGGVDAGEVEPFEPQGMPDGGARMAIEEVVDGGGDRSAQLAAAMLWRRLYSDDSSTPWRNIARRLSAETDELSAREMIWLARLYEDLWRRQAIIDEAADLHGDDPLVIWRRAKERGESMAHLDRRDQRRNLESLVEDHPDFLMAVISLAHWYQYHEGSERALRILERFDAEDRTETPAWIRMAARLTDSAGDRQRAAKLRRRAADVHRLSGTFGRDLLREAIASGDRKTALAMVDEYQRRAPWSKNWSIREAMLLRASEELEEAVGVVDALIEDSPQDPDLRRRRAELLLTHGDRDGAIDALEQAISLRPQATDYQKYLEHLQPEPSRFYEPWRYTDLRKLAAEADAGSQSWDRLVDQSIHQVASNGLASEYVQRADRVLRDEGVGSARQTRVTYRPGDERVEVLGVRVLKADGTISEDYDQWERSRTRQGARRYNDRGYVNLRANNVDVGDIVEFQYVVHQVANENFRGDYFGDVSYVQSTRPIHRMRYAVHYPDDWDLYFRRPRLPHEGWSDALPDGEGVDGQSIEAFELRDVPRVHTEDDQPGNTDIYDYILVSNKETFDDVGAWWWELIEEQLVVDDDIADKARVLTEGLDDDVDKLRAIHEYVVRNTRYLHVGLGIHGWKPYRTSTVFRNQYGDCKDKAALLKVMLEEVGIDAEMVLVRTRRLGSVDGDPASMNIFNHAVTYVPSKDLFVDPTARYNGVWELTQMDQGAQALIVREGGETEWRTMPVDEADDNLTRQTLEVDHRQQTPVMTGRVEAHGANAVRDRRRLEDPERRDEDFESRLQRRFSGLSLLDAEYDNLDALDEPSEIRFRAEVPGARQSGSRGDTIYPWVTPRDLLDRYARQSTRRQDLIFRVPFAREAEVRHRLPEEMVVERIPEGTEVDSPFGELALSYRQEGDELVVDLRYSIDVQRVDVDDYREFRRFVADIDEALDESIRLIEREETG